MDVILLERIARLGQMGDVVKVKPGFARNYLLPQKKALRATKENLEFFSTQRQHLEAENLKRKEEAEAVAKKMEGLTMLVIRQAGESGHLYGSVTNRDVAAAMADKNVGVQRGQVVIDKPIKELGLFPVRIVLHPEVTVTVTVNVAQSEDEAKAQADRVARGLPAVLPREKAYDMAEEEAQAVKAQAEAVFEKPEAAADIAAEPKADDDAKAKE